ncbi:unnamed protein product, partial [Protopolystoma xenopodis]
MPKSLVDFYYMWKTTDHHVQQKRMKAAEAEHRLKQVYIPNYNKPNPAVLYPPSGNPGVPDNPPNRCEGCQALNSAQWYALGPPTCLLKVCSNCWNYWKRYGDLKASSILSRVNGTQSSGNCLSDLSFTCPVKPCSEEFSSRVHLAQHLEAFHQHIGSHLADEVQPGPSSTTHPVSDTFSVLPTEAITTTPYSSTCGLASVSASLIKSRGATTSFHW